MGPELDLRVNRSAAGPGLFLDRGTGHWWVADVAQREIDGITGWHAPVSLGSINDIDLGTSLQSRVSLLTRTALETRLGYPLGALSDIPLADMLALDIFGRLADPTGADAVRPIRMMRDKGLNLCLDNQLAHHENFNEGHPNWQSTLAVQRASYQAVRGQVEAKLNSADPEVQAEGQAELNSLKRQTGYYARRYFRRSVPTSADLDALLPPEYRDDGYLPPATTLTDNFNRSGALDGSTSSGGGDWTLTRTGVYSTDGSICVLASAGADTFCRLNSDLSGADHYAQVDWGTYGGGWVGVQTRMVSSTTGYFVAFFGGTTYKMYQMGGYSQMGANITNAEPTSTIKLESDGDNHTLFVDGSSVATRTDSNLPSNVQCGMAGDPNTADSDVDNWIAEDLAAVPAPLFRPRVMVF